jgi:hypothetical protein
MKDIILKAKHFETIPLGPSGTGTLSHDLNRWWHQVRKRESIFKNRVATALQKAQVIMYGRYKI